MEILRVEKINKKYLLRSAFKIKGEVEALKDISFRLYKNEVLGIIGESGSGKSTLAYIIAGLIQPDSGKIFFKDKDLLKSYRTDKDIRQKIQIIFQDPYNTLNPRYTVYKTISEPVLIHRTCPKKEIKDRVIQTMELVGLQSDYMNKYPHQLSGGERQRVAIARAIILEPELLICDEPTSNLDLSIQAQILNLLLEIKNRQAVSIIFITHDINIAALMCERILVLYKGEIVETGLKEEVLKHSSHPYTKNLLQATIFI
jgi:ABC-type glutathione transport system ATPase component